MDNSTWLYIGQPGSTEVLVCRKPARADDEWLPTGGLLPKRLDIANHSPSGFSWGFAGSGPAQLALALIAHATGDAELAQRFHQRFKFAVVARLPQSEGWQMTSNVVRALVGFLVERHEERVPFFNPGLGEPAVLTEAVAAALSMPQLVEAAKAFTKDKP